MLLVATAARAFDFEAPAVTGQTLYFTATGATEVKVVNPGWGSKPMPAGLLSIPASVSDASGNSYRVTAIDARAFLSCTTLTGVVVPEGVTTIGQLAFGGCSALDSIVLPTTLSQIGAQAFNGCAYTQDEGRWSDDGVLYVSGFVISAKQDVTGTLAIADGTIGTANGAFFNCQSVAKVVVPTSMAMIGDIAFQNCTALDTMVMNGSVPPALGFNAFLNGSDNLTIVVPCHSVETYAHSAYWSDLALTEDCGGDIEPEGIEPVDLSPVAVTVVGGGLYIDAAGRTLTVCDAMGRRVAESHGGFVALPAHGIYMVGAPGMKAIKIVY